MCRHAADAVGANGSKMHRRIRAVLDVSEWIEGVATIELKDANVGEQLYSRDDAFDVAHGNSVEFACVV
jgi:hypothetical protein